MSPKATKCLHGSETRDGQQPDEQHRSKSPFAQCIRMHELKAAEGTYGTLGCSPNVWDPFAPWISLRPL